MSAPAARAGDSEEFGFWGPGAPICGPLAWARAFAGLPEARYESAWILSDLHLPSEAGARTEAFVAWCAGVATTAREGHGPTRVVCLGDLFDAWVGRCQLRLSGTLPVTQAIAALGAVGVPFDLVPGNRDTLLDGAFEAASGARLRRDGLVLVGPAGERVLCLHGDELCIREPGYLRLRQAMRWRWFRALSRVAPLWFARFVARRLRGNFAGSRGERLVTRGPQRDAALAAARSARAALVVSGHSHAPADVSLPAVDALPVDDGRPVRWVTLGAFGEAMDVARVAPGPGVRVEDSERAATVGP